ncbi:MAG: type II toxin-antitoxin system HicB family antitoxin [bacterium]|nr:type II toxin-antitoxin system HicB family antitoxin [bacterium]
MKLYHIAVEQEEGWYVGRVLERSGVTTQGRTLDELVFMLRDAIEALWHEKDVQLELSLGPSVKVPDRRKTPKRAARA